MSSLNLVMLIGRLGGDPEGRQLTDGRPVARFSLATTLRWKNSAGSLEEKTDWHRVVAFGALAQTALAYLVKGRQVFVSGRLQTRGYLDKNGAKAHTTEVVLNRLVMLGKKSDTNPATELDHASDETADLPV